jgi:PTH1 family peptidyl-tRNA hydrolase
MLPIQLIVGLGNPGDKYTATRHNAGAWFVEEVASTINCPLRPAIKLHGRHAIATKFDPECHLVIPSTYMNDSGLCLRAVANYYKIPPQAILIVHDDIDLPPGTIRLKFDGGSGGHNGLKDIIDHLHTRQFHRLRIGVGHPGHSNAVVDYVLNRPSTAERTLIDAAISRAHNLLPTLVKGDFAKAMQELHQG